ncbi:hypothetical protein SAMN05192566_2476 [Methylophilus rhizosphaerae]|uniref:Copper(I)-binding protein n=1 Tax=Methylophilus rhizosphaerae TaxID=492660 RepID=A0A1G9EVD3_9PROT|nr:copper chaperone PCu(A)C [Methylophilus rhizosphaerae]SDK80080.1 hypothetical protein SAMN05192566_2476 [Methylophilus rhizosphaerae]
MKSYLKIGLVIISMAGFTVSAHADLQVLDAWVKPTMPGQPVAGAYMTLVADKETEIVDLSSPVAGKTEVHSMSMQGNVMKMKRLARVKLKAGEKMELKPGGFHIMLMELNHQIKEGEVVPISLVTQDGSGKKTTVSVKAIAASPENTEAPSGMHMHHH